MSKKTRRTKKPKTNPLAVHVFGNGDEKDKGGRPPKHDAESILAAVREYFTFCVVTKMTPTKAGVCLWLGISRDTYSEYRKKFSDTIKTIDMMIEESWVQRLKGNSTVGAIFYLKNAFKDEYKDRTDHDLTTGGQPITGMRIAKEKA